MKNDYSCGMIPYRVVDGRREYLLVQHLAGHWSFPKGHPEEGESPLATARRELAEETGLVPAETLESPAFEESYKFTKGSGKKVRKKVTYYLCVIAPDAAVSVQPEEIGDHAWGGAAQTRGRLTFEEGRALLDQVEQFLAQSTDA